jgi:WD40 repeat protein
MTTFYGHSGTINAASFTPDGKFLATVSEDATLKMWRVSSNAEKFTIAGKTFHQGNILSLSFHEGKPLIATGGEDEVFCVSSSEHGEVYFKSPPVEGVVEAVCFGSAWDNKTRGAVRGDFRR